MRSGNGEPAAGLRYFGSWRPENICYVGHEEASSANAAYVGRGRMEIVFAFHATHGEFRPLGAPLLTVGSKFYEGKIRVSGAVSHTVLVV